MTTQLAFSFYDLAQVATPVHKRISLPVPPACLHLNDQTATNPSIDFYDALDIPAKRMIDFRNWPNISGKAANRHGQTLGLWGETALHARLLSWGYEVMLPGPGAAFDVGVIVPIFLPSASRKQGFVRIQTKASSSCRNGRVTFNITKGFRASGEGVRPYHMDDFDLVAMGSSIHNAFIFSSDKHRSRAFRADEMAMFAQCERDTFEAALHEIGALTSDEYDMLNRISTPASRA